MEDIELQQDIVKLLIEYSFPIKEGTIFKSSEKVESAYRDGVIWLDVRTMADDSSIEDINCRFCSRIGNITHLQTMFFKLSDKESFKSYRKEIVSTRELCIQQRK